jgi:protein involved in polysaccharide export with SLBB domain
MTSEPFPIEYYFASRTQWEPVDCEDEDEEIEYTPEEIDLKEDDKLGSTDPYEPLFKEYIISTGDLLNISVQGDEDTVMDNLVVAPDGKIYYIFLDGIPAAGRSLKDVQKDLEDRLKPFFLAPVVTILPKEVTAQKFKIIGRVRRSGEYPLNNAVTIRQAIGIAGGIISDREIFGTSTGLVQNVSNINVPVTNLKKSFIIRNTQKLDVDFEKLLFEPDKQKDIFLKPGDYIYIASDNRPGIFVMGNVTSSTIVPHKEGITILKALGYVGGWTMGFPLSADVGNVLVIRNGMVNPEVAHVDLCDLVYGRAKDIYLEPGDILYVHNKTFRFGRTLIRLALNSFANQFGEAAGQFYGSIEFHTHNPNSTSDGN